MMNEQSRPHHFTWIGINNYLR